MPALPGTFRAAGAIAWRLVGIGLAGWGVLHIAELTSEILIPIAVGILLTALLAPLVRVGRRWFGGSTYLHAGLTVVLTLAAVGGVLFSSATSSLPVSRNCGQRRCRAWPRSSRG